MKTITIVLGIIILVVGAFYLIFSRDKSLPVETFSPRSSPPASVSDVPATAVVAENLDTPWAIAFLPDPPARFAARRAGEAGRSMLVTERPGRVRLVNSAGQLEEQAVVELPQVKEIGEGGLLGIAVHPNFLTKTYVYLYYTYSSSGGNTLNRVVRMTYENQKLLDEQIIVDRIPGALNHNGGRIKFGPDGYLYITTGDAQNPSLAQDTSSLAGKILRVTDEGKPAPGNPFDNLVYSYGHRNPQGITWDKLGRFWGIEHGSSGNDEINEIEAGKNYGWPIIQGDEKRQGMIRPIIHSGASTTWAPAGAAFVESSIFLGGLRGQTLYEAKITEDPVNLTEHFKGEFGRIREVIVGSDNLLYITTSNQDGRGTPAASDDKILRINPQKL